jgi:hypothetical protein
MKNIIPLRPCAAVVCALAAVSLLRVFAQIAPQPVMTLAPFTRSNHGVEST